MYCTELSARLFGESEVAYRVEDMFAALNDVYRDLFTADLGVLQQSNTALSKFPKYAQIEVHARS